MKNKENKMIAKALQKIDRQITESLDVIVKRIKKNLALMVSIAERMTYDQQVEIGKDLLLAERKVTGSWYRWLDKNFSMSIQTAKRYMLAARKEREKHTIAGKRRFRNITEALRDTDPTYALPRHKKNEQPIRNIVDEIDTDIFAERQKTETKERRLKKEMALELVEAGFRALSHKFHSDKGGSDDAMRRLDEVRKILSHAITRNEITFQNE